MRYSLVVDERIWHRLREHLLRDQSEHLAFLLARLSGNSLLVRDLVEVSDEALEDGARRGGLSLRLSVLLDIMNKANRQQLMLVEAHSHPFCKHEVGFSAIDLEGQQELAAYLADVSPGRLYAALVLGQEAVTGLVWSDSEKPTRLDEVRVVGPVLERWRGDGIPRQSRTRTAGNGASGQHYHRQVLALGPGGQRLLQTTRVAVVGAGGIGSVVLQELAYLGVSAFLIIDDDAVEASNLNRLVGASPASVDRLKVDVMKDMIDQINPRASVEGLSCSIRESPALAAVRTADVIMGCVDTDSARLILNETALAYLIPYVDSGVGIEVKDREIVEAGGRVVVWVPGRPCLLCSKDISPRIAAEELETPEEHKFRQTHGYVEGASVPEPAVISLNGTVASLAVTEFLALVTGLRPSNHYTYYDMLQQCAGRRVVRPNPGCIACAVEGLGDLANIDRYCRVGLPGDLPRLGGSQ